MLTNAVHLGNPLFKGRYVCKFHCGGATSFSHDKNFILVHLPDVQHGANENLTWLYHLLRWELWRDGTKSAGTLYIDWDGGPENTDITTQLFFCHLIAMGWKIKILTHRMVRNHTHNKQDQVFYILRYTGWKTTLFTTSLAQGLFKLLLGFAKAKRDDYVILLLASAYDWRTYFQGSANPNFKYYQRPLAWQYSVAEDGTFGLPAVRVKTMGDGQQEWHGEEDKPGGAPLLPYLGPPGTLSMKFLSRTWSSILYCSVVATRQGATVQVGH